MHIRPDDPGNPPVADLLREHLRSMEQTSPPESRHALDIDGLRQPGITFFSIWDWRPARRLRRAEGAG